MTIPSTHIEVPQRVRELAVGAALTPVWHNNIGGLTFRTDDDRFIKHGPLDLEANMRDEAERMRWASKCTRVPEAIEQGQDAAHEWLVTVAIPGESAVAPRWIDEPATAVRAVGEALRALHDALPVDECPWSWGVSDRIANAEARGVRVPDAMRETPAIDKLVVCHGDACVPNTLLDADGRWLAHVDLAMLGAADRWADIAVASMSTEWNYGPGWEDALIEAYGIEPDRERLAYYRAVGRDLMAHPIMFQEDDPLLARVRAIAPALPEADEKVSHGRPAFFTQKVFCYFGGSVRSDDEWISHDAAIMVRPDPDDDPALRQDARFWVPAYLGPSGWLGIDLDDGTKGTDTDWQEIAEFIDASYRMTASRRLVQELDER